MTKNVDIDKYGYSGYEIGFDRTSSFSFPGGRLLVFGADISSSTHINNRKKDINFPKRTNARIRTYLKCRKKYSINFTVTKKKFCLSLHYSGTNSYLFVNGTEIYKFKAKDSEIVATPLCLGNISKDWSVDNMKKTGFNGYVYDFSIEYDAITVDHILDIDKYLMKKNNVV